MVLSAADTISAPALHLPSLPPLLSPARGVYKFLMRRITSLWTARYQRGDIWRRPAYHFSGSSAASA